MSSSPNSVDLKIVVLGAASVGKTSVIHRYCNGVFQPDTLSTIGAGFFTHSINIGNTEVTLLLWDTAGEERFRSVAPSLLRGANGLVLVYDVTQPSSFDDLNVYLEMFLDTVQVDMACELPILLLGNKNDLGSQVNQSNIDAWCSKNRIVHKYVGSAKTGDNIEDSMNNLVQCLLEPVQTSDRPTLQLTPIPAKKDEGCC